ncbi:DUF2075 domain-containing protein [Aerococcaceae bacterium DSM 109653]|uniref:DUF2075 domain-containing protein n=1 Tax=Fundicoccus ignavus TaxID=2664442 RepID=A0A844BXU8_9LACT|nr:DUF2075 domain-containing protein [Fundicoccus ignavus]MRI82723.1 DUF2075 domain-containing protein [Fundicoccus ignavus]
MKKIPTPLVRNIHFDLNGIQSFKDEMTNSSVKNSELLLDYPTVYIVNNKDKKDKYNIYIGETSDIISRTEQHLKVDPALREDWLEFYEAEEARMFVIGHDYFNKSLTLDIENKLMHYLSSVDSVEKVYNRRTNQQNKYYTSKYFEDIFSKVWRQLRKENHQLFPVESIIKDSALYKASPFHKLSEEQLHAKEKIKTKIIEAYSKNSETSQLILVAGEAGSGKTVLLSSLFYEINKLEQDYPENKDISNIKANLLVNHDQQLTVYENIAKKLGIFHSKNNKIVSKPTTFINNHIPEEKVDVIIVDEAHLLWTQGKQSYRGENQLYDLLERAKVVVAVFDINQVLTTEQYWEQDELLNIEQLAKQNDNYIYLSNQMRIAADENTVRWVRTFIDDQVVMNIPKDTKNYEIKVFENPEALHNAIKSKSSDGRGISRLTATFDWEYIDKKKPEDSDYWRVKENDWSIPWNLQIPVTPAEKRKNRDLSWAEQPHTIEEAGSTYTVQGFDLNYTGVIIGPSVKYRNGKIIYDRKNSQNKKATRRRTLNDGSQEYLSDTLLRNELNVLLTRGIHGLYIYAVDKELQEALLKAQAGKLN